MADEPSTRGGWTRLALLGALVVGSTLVFKYAGVADRVTIGEIRAARDAIGMFAPLLYVAIYVVAAIVAFPGLVVTLVGGLLFGTVAGGALAVTGASIGAVAAFWIARLTGRSTVERFVAGGRLEGFDRVLSGSGFSAVLFTRLVPGVPFNMINFVWGLTGVRFRDYVAATVLGMIPGAFIYANLGGAIARTYDRDDATLASIDYARLLNRDVLVSVALLALLTLVPTIVKLARRAER